MFEFWGLNRIPETNSTWCHFFYRHYILYELNYKIGFIDTILFQQNIRIDIKLTDTESLRINSVTCYWDFFESIKEISWYSLVLNAPNNKSI